MNARKHTAGDQIRAILGKPILIAAFAAAAVFCIARKDFLSFSNLHDVLGSASLRILMALGLMGCMLSGGIDLSAGSQMGFAACLTGILCQSDDFAGKYWKLVPQQHPGAALLIVLGLGLIWGLLNGLLTVKGHVPPLFATLGTQAILTSCTLTLTRSQPIAGLSKGMKTLVSGFFGSPEGIKIPYLFCGAVLIAFAVFLIDRKTCLGRRIRLAGNSMGSGEGTEKKTRSARILVYLLAGALYAGAGFLTAFRAGSVSASVGNGYELEAIAACLAGGVSAAGCTGGVLGVCLGVLALEAIRLMIGTLGLPQMYHQAFLGITVIVMAMLNLRKRKWR